MLFLKGLGVDIVKREMDERVCNANTCSCIASTKIMWEGLLLFLSNSCK